MVLCLPNTCLLIYRNNDQINSCTCSLFSLPDIILLVPPLQVQRMCNNRGAICPPSALSPATIVVTYHRARRPGAGVGHVNSDTRHVGNVLRCLILSIIGTIFGKGTYYHHLLAKSTYTITPTCADTNLRHYYYKFVLE